MTCDQSIAVRLRAALAAARLLDTAARLADHGQPLSSGTLYCTLARTGSARPSPKGGDPYGGPAS